MAQQTWAPLRFSRRTAMRTGAVAGAAALLGGTATVSAQAPCGAAGQADPQAGTWRTWLLDSGSQLRLPAPPDASATKDELASLRTLASQRDTAASDRIAFWDAGSPSHRWNEIAIDALLRHNFDAVVGSRAMALVHVAVYDAMIAAWDSKYAYNRPRPSQADATIQPAVAVPQSPSYPSEHAAAAGAASAVLTYLFPDDAQRFADQATQAGNARLLAGVQYPSDVSAGMDLGKSVAALAIARGQADGSDAKWTGSVPTDPGHWTGTDPVWPLAGTWKTWVLASGSDLRPGPPPAYDSSQEAADLAELKDFQRTPKSNEVAFFWQYGAGPTRGVQLWNGELTRRLLEYWPGASAPRAARAYAAASVAYYDAAVACWDAKYAYWAIRPFQLDPTFKTLFPTPNHPSYPAAHGTLSSAAAAAIAYLFPRDAQELTALGEQAAVSRMWGGIHFRSDINAGLALGRAVTQKVIERVHFDGSEPL